MKSDPPGGGRAKGGKLMEKDKEQMLGVGPKSEIKDRQFVQDVTRSEFKNKIFIRLTAVEKRFEKVDFKYCTFDACYLRKCTFDSCDFTGCRFVGTSFSGSNFSGCKFDYAVFERTDIDGDILVDGRPSEENLAMRFSRSLRLNFQQMGDVESANRAIRVELDATGVHLSKAWKANTGYHKRKYGGQRLKYFLKWVRFRFLELLWGHGESVSRLCISLLVVILIIALSEFLLGAPPITALTDAPQVLLGIANPMKFPGLVMALIVVIRLVFFSLFTSTLIKRLSRR
ncbi:pentapeptide repeat-containing protein [Luteibacter anthropi]|uniref:pentapeptide repeat-containing protein n=1 Tax=Luteibacter anthropi TaxID=564369 RepID=UPI002032DBF6|nr:pentapeptide repeat-containing protein [Luteibacter anthropi]URX62041.1 pentapeptide repeat-containing protein [Luteibacter anthropi]